MSSVHIRLPVKGLAIGVMFLVTAQFTYLTYLPYMAGWNGQASLAGDATGAAADLPRNIVDRTRTTATAASSSTREMMTRNAAPERIQTLQRLQTIDSVYQLPVSDDFWWQNETQQGLQANVSTSSHLLRIFVYDNLPNEFSSDIEKVLNSIYTSNHSKPDSELIWIRLFRSYPGRTYNASEADLFVVPYPAFAHCRFMTHPDEQRFPCRHIPQNTTAKLLMSNLNYYHGNEHPHLFLVGNDAQVVHNNSTQHPLVLSFGPRSPVLSQPGHIITTIFNDLPRYQPSVLLNHSGDYWTRDRKYSFIEMSGKVNSHQKRSRDRRKWRRLFAQQIFKKFPGVTDRFLGGKPFTMNAGNTGRLRLEEVPLYDLYTDSVFCPVLPGDTTWQRRFFDVILSGCIPVVLRWDIPDLSPGNKSWWQPNWYGKNFQTHATASSLPFYPGLFGEDPSIEIDYESFVVECTMDMSTARDLSHVWTAMQAYLVNHTEEIRLRQLRIREYALAFSIGLGRDAH